MTEDLASWTPLWLLEGVFVAVVAALALAGRSRRPGDPLRWIPAGLERVVRIPGWAAAMVGMSWFGLLVAGIGFYNDVAWHIALGRDKELFTAPHTMIVVGLGTIAVSAAVGIFVATIEQVGTGVRVGPLRVPWSAIPMGLLGLTALSGFGLDELWHEQYGIDVTMWSPTHLLMIVGASLSPIAGWLALGEARVRPEDGRWARGVHVAVAWMVLAGLSSVQGEFDFGVPQFQQLYLPVLFAVAAGFALVAARLVLGPGWVLLVGALSLLVRVNDGAGGEGVVTTRSATLYVGAAVIVELVAWAVGTARRTRFAVVSAVGIGTAGLATEWWWNQGAHQPWRESLLPDAVLVAVLGAFGAALLGTAIAGPVTGRPARVPRALVAVGLAVVVAALVIPLPRQVGDVTAELTLDRSGDEAVVDVRLDPPDAADDARWFQATSWQGGGLVLAEMEEVGEGHYRSERALPVTGDWKTMVRLHRGAELMTVPVWFPADPEIDEPEIPAVDRTMAFQDETGYLMRETEAGDAWFSRLIFGVLAAIVAAWVGSFVLAAARIGHEDEPVDLRQTDGVRVPAASPR